MDHIVTVAISLDDEDIKKHIEDTITKQVSEQLVSKIATYILDRNGGINGVCRQVMNMALNRYRSEILDTAIKDVTLTIKRSPRYRSAVKKIDEIAASLDEYEVVEEIEDEEED